MIDAKIPNSVEETTSASTPMVITVSGIINDLDNGIDREGIAQKYALTPAEVKVMFQHPALKGKRVKKNKVASLRFQLVDDTATSQTTPSEETVVDPAQTDLITAIEEAESTQDFNNDFDIDNY